MRVLALVLLAAVVATAAAATSSCIDCPEYVKLSAADKAASIWKKITDSTYPSNPNDWYTFSEADLLVESMNEPFDRFSDELPQGRKKLIHTFGVVGQVKFDVLPGSPYSGMFQGADYCFIRPSAAANPSKALTPGMAMKCLRDGTYSGNIISMYELTGQGADWNFMKHEMKSWVSDGKGLFLSFGAAVFEKGAKDPFHLSNDAMAAGSQDGSTVDSSEFATPDVIYFKPAVGPWPSDNHDYREDFQALSVGTKLYEVWGASGCDCGSARCASVDQCSTSVQIGSLTTTSPFVASSWGDRNMFFQHSRSVKKQRSTCVYKDSLDDNAVVRMAGRHNAQCVASDDGSCPEIGATLGLFGDKAESSTLGCPFMLDVLNGGSASSYDAAGTDAQTQRKAKGSSKDTLVIVLGSAVGVLAVALVAVVVVFKRRERRMLDTTLEGKALQAEEAL